MKHHNIMTSMLLKKYALLAEDKLLYVVSIK